MMTGWLARLKTEKNPTPYATKPTKPPQGVEKVGFVGFVAYPPAPFEKIEMGEGATKAQARNLSKPDFQTGVGQCTLDSTTVGEVSGVVTTDPANGAAPATAPDPLATVDVTDLHTWPHTQAMNPGEVEAFTARLVRFADKGLHHSDAERLADVLVTRDREGDDRRLCLECNHLQGHGRWRCGNWQAANVARDGLVREVVLMLQRCPGFRRGTL